MKIKNMRIITLSLVLLMAFTLTSYSKEARKSGFVFEVSGGGVFGVTDIQDDFNSINAYSIIQTGYLFGLSRSVGTTFLLDMGYSTSVSLKSIDANNFNIGGSAINEVVFHNFQLGISQVLNIGNFSIGVGGGAKFPIVAFKTTTFFSGDDYSDLGSSVTFRNEIDGDFMPVPYAKATLDYSLFFDTRTAVTFGLNIEYVFDTGYKHSVYDGNPEGLYVGAQMGIKLSPR